MGILSWWRELDTLMRRVVSISLALLALILIIVTVSWCSENRGRSDARKEVTITDARMGSAEQAIDIIGDVGRENADVSEQVRDAQNELSQISDPVERDRRARQRLRDIQQDSAPAR